MYYFDDDEEDDFIPDPWCNCQMCRSYYSYDHGYWDGYNDAYYCE